MVGEDPGEADGLMRLDDTVNPEGQGGAMVTSRRGGARVPED